VIKLTPPFPEYDGPGSFIVRLRRIDGQLRITASGGPPWQKIISLGPRTTRRDREKEEW